MLLDWGIYLIHHYFGGKTIAPELPRSLDRKLDYLRKCHAGIPAVAAIPQGLAIINGFSRLREDRHTLTHGIPFTNKMENIASSVAVLRLRYSPQEHHHEEKHYDLEFLMQMFNDTSQLSRDTAVYVRALIAVLSPNQPN
jgi:hypothetical protein